MAARGNKFLPEYKLFVVGDGDCCRKQCVVDGEAIILDVLDITGREEYGIMGEQYLRAGDGFILVYSITSRSSFKSISTFHRQILRVKKRYSFPIVLVANKCELENKRQVSREEGQELAEQWNCEFFEVSTKDYDTVEKVFYTLFREIRDYPKLIVTVTKSSRGITTLKKKVKHKCLVM